MNIPKAAGLTLIELIVALALGIILTIATLQSFLTIKQIFIMQQALARLQENGRMAGILLGHAIRTRGNMGCTRFKPDMILHIQTGIDQDAYGLSQRDPLLGLQLAQVKNHSLLQNTMLERIIPDNDILWIKTTRKNYALIESTKGEEGFVLIQGRPILQEQQIIILADCAQGEALKILQFEPAGKNRTKITFAPPIIESNLNKQYATNATVGIFSSKLFYIANTMRKNHNQNPIYALFCTDLNGRTLELIEGVERFQIKYGIQNDSNINYFTDAQVIRWQDITHIKITLLLNSVEETLQKPSLYKDRLMRLEWTYEWPLTLH